MHINILTISILFLITHAQRLTVNPLNSYLTDQKGRFIFYHGVNVVNKQFPFYPKLDKFNPMDSLTSEDFQHLKSWGMNGIRLFVSWEGFQPIEGRYNYTYLEAIKNMTRMAQDYGIDIILDAHQDLFSKRFCGEGFPDWLFTTDKTKTEGYYSVLNFPSPLKVELRFDKQGNPLIEDCMKQKFIKYYLSEDVMRFSQMFFTNKNGMADKFIRMWMNVIGYFKTEDNVIGYDLINEPSGANLWKNPYNYIGPGVNSNKYLLPFYKKLASEIRKIDQEKLILFQPFPVDFVGGFYDTPSPKQFKNLDVLSYHTYCPFVNEHAEPTSQSKCHLLEWFMAENRHRIINRLKCGSMLTEFGSVPESEKGLQQIKRVLGYAQNYWQNWFWWQYKYYNDYTCSSNPPWQQSFYYPNGEIQEKKVKLLSHPYAYAVCGTPISQQSTPTSYYLKIQPKKCGGSYTEIYLNEAMYFPNGFSVTFSPNCAQCYLENVGKYRSYYKVILSDEVLHGEVQIKIAGYI